MKDTSVATAQNRWWDWVSILLLFLLLQVVASRLVITAWTPFLHLIQGITSTAFVIGAAGGYSNFTRRTVRWFSFFYMIMLLPLQWIEVIDKQVALEEQLTSVGGRLLFSISEFFTRRPVEDPLFFIAIMSVAFWVLSASAGYHLIRNQNFLAVIIPSTIGILVIQNYDNGASGRLWVLAIFALAALFLLGRLNFFAGTKTLEGKTRLSLARKQHRPDKQYGNRGSFDHLHRLDSTLFIHENRFSAAGLEPDHQALE